VLFAAASASSRCTGGDTPDPPELQWWTTCGDPVCSGYDGPFDGVPLCTDETEGDPCADDTLQCDFESDCNALLVCAEDDPTAQTGGCPISRIAHKTEVNYLDDDALRAMANRALSTRLATWRYRWEEQGHKPHVGFMIDDDPTSPAVRADGEHVDLYGYTSLSLAAVQAQQAEIDEIRVELTKLRSQLESCSQGPVPQPSPAD
jgi:hypothetical protein